MQQIDATSNKRLSNNQTDDIVIKNANMFPVIALKLYCKTKKGCLNPRNMG